MRFRLRPGRRRPGRVSSDWYQFNVNAGDNLVITTTTPGGTSASGLQFANDLDPTINLYDASGNLVATATGNAADGRNDVIDWTALTSGSYRVQILGSSKTNLGEYTISIQGATGGAPAFVGHLDHPGGRLRHRLPGLDHDGQRQQQRPAVVDLQPQRLHDRRQRRHRRHRRSTATP